MGGGDAKMSRPLWRTVGQFLTRLNTLWILLTVLPSNSTPRYSHKRILNIRYICYIINICLPICSGFPIGSDGKESACNVWAPDREDPLKEGMATHSSIHSCLENPTDRGAWWTTVHGLTKSWTQLSGWLLFSLSWLYKDLYVNAYSHFIYNCQNLEILQMSTIG